MGAALRQFRVFVAALLLVAQALGLEHLVFAEHSFDGAGAIVEVGSPHRQVHGHAQTIDEAHFCENIVSSHADKLHVCMVVAAWAAASTLSEREDGVATRVRGRQAIGLARASVMAKQFDALSRAPKCSPPWG